MKVLFVGEKLSNKEKIIFSRKSSDIESEENSVSETEKESSSVEKSCISGLTDALARHDRSFSSINVTALHRPSSEQSSSQESKKSESTLSTHSSIQSGSLPVTDSSPSFRICLVQNPVVKKEYLQNLICIGVSTA